MDDPGSLAPESRGSSMLSVNSGQLSCVQVFWNHNKTNEGRKKLCGLILLENRSKSICALSNMLADF